MKEIVIDSSNLYVQGLMKIFNKFMIEEASGQVFTEDRLKKNIESLRNALMDERMRMKVSGDMPKFEHFQTDGYNLLFKF